MEERRKIIIPVAAKPETPHFDAEETLLSARPVVPLSHASAAQNFNHAHTIKRAPFYRRNGFLMLVVTAAIGIGLAAGLGIARYRYTSSAPVVARPAQPSAPSDTRTATVQPANDNQQAQTPVALPEVKTGEDATVDENANGDKAQASVPESTTKVSSKAPDNSTDKDDDEGNAQTTTRDRKRTGDDDDESDNANTSPRSQRRERRVRNRDDGTVDIPRTVERAGEQINRIREIFEGRQRP